MLEYDRINVSEGIETNKTDSSRKCNICHYWCFFKIKFRFKPEVCHGCPDMTQKSIWALMTLQMLLLLIIELTSGSWLKSKLWIEWKEKADLSKKSWLFWKNNSDVVIVMERDTPDTKKKIRFVLHGNNTKKKAKKEIEKGLDSIFKRTKKYCKLGQNVNTTL